MNALDIAGVTTEYAVRYTERRGSGQYVATAPIGSSGDQTAAEASALKYAARCREYQEGAGLPVDAVAVVCTVTVTPWEPIPGQDVDVARLINGGAA